MWQIIGEVKKKKKKIVEVIEVYYYEKCIKIYIFQNMFCSNCEKIKAITLNMLCSIF